MALRTDPAACEAYVVDKVVNKVSTTLNLENRLRDRKRVESELGLSEFG